MCKQVPDNFLASYHLNALLLPRTGIAPLWLFRLTDNALIDEHQGLSASAPGIPWPQPVASQVANLAGQRLEQVDLGLGVGWLNGFCLAKLAFQYQRATRLSFAFDDVAMQAVGRFQLDQVLAKAPPGTWPPSLTDQARAGRLFVVLAVVTATSVVVQALDRKGITVKPELQGVQQAVGEIAVTVESGDLIRYRRKTPIVVALQAVPLRWDDASGVLSCADDSGRIPVAMGPSMAPRLDGEGFLTAPDGLTLSG